MPFTLDPKLADVLSAHAERAAAAGPASAMPARGDVVALKAMSAQTIGSMLSGAEPAPDVTFSSHSTTTDDGASIDLRWYTRSGSTPGSAIVYVHGGGLISGSLQDYDPLIRQYVQWSGVPQLAVEYRLAPQATGETPARDALAAVRWLVQHADEFEVDLERIAVMGDSGGGGVGAGAVILARDQGLALAKQILIYPMLDDRNTEPDPDLASLATWSYDANYTGWFALLGQDIGGDGVSPVAAPARLQDFSGLPPTYIEVGGLDIFRDECISYARRLLRAGVDTDLLVQAGYPHGADWFGYGTPWKDRWKTDRVRAMTSF